MIRHLTTIFKNRKISFNFFNSVGQFGIGFSVIKFYTKTIINNFRRFLFGPGTYVSLIFKRLFARTHTCTLYIVQYSAIVNK